LADLEPDAIWDGDLFNRKPEADNLIAYIESFASRPSRREDVKSFTIAVDAPYGVGKTYFLKRLAKQLELNHPVAYVDAWADDIQDEPLIALVATIKKAFVKNKGLKNVSKKLDDVIEKTGKIVKIVALGAAKKIAATFITTQAVETIDQVLKVENLVKNTLAGSAEDLGNEAVSAGEKIVKVVQSDGLMKDRIDEFEQAQRAVSDLKESLKDLVEALEGQEIHAPVVIIIDELDRCRPPYAIKLLEEIKHLFDVPGIVFILGINSSQFTASIKTAYGSDFDAHHYLRRFINRTYILKEPDLDPLIGSLIIYYGIDENRLFRMNLKEGYGSNKITLSNLISFYMKAFDLKARDAFEIVEMIQTSLALTGKKELIADWLLIKILSFIKTKSTSVIPEAVNKNFKIGYLEFDRAINDFSEISPFKLLEQISKFKPDVIKEFNTRTYNSQGDKISMHVFYKNKDIQDIGLATEQLALYPWHYDEIINTVGRFSNPVASGSFAGSSTFVATSSV
jgi:hypothetical protein